MDRWKNKLVAWTHDPAEKALILMRRPGGHEAGTVKNIQQALSLEGATFNKAADWWAAAADRPNFPLPSDEGNRYWHSVYFATEGELIHPLVGKTLKMSDFNDLGIDLIEEASFNHLEGLIRRDSAGEIDYRETFFAFWRFGPSSKGSHLGKLAKVLPADSRVPDHSIWQHLDLTSAFSSLMGDWKNEKNMEADIALLEVSIGPVQEFIAQARSTSDLWSGSHLLSSLSFEALSLIVDEYGPDNVIFPALRGNPMMDEWLVKSFSRGESDDWWRNQLRNDEYSKRVVTASNRSNPLYTSTIPNKIVALVEWSKAPVLGERIKSRLAEVIRRYANDALNEILGVNLEEITYVDDGRLEAQLDGFPEVSWSVVKWPGNSSMPSEEGRSIKDGVDALKQFRTEIAGAEDESFSSNEWRAVQKDISIEGFKIYNPNPGIFYGILHSTLDSLHSAQKSTPTFGQLPQVGYRCTTCGDREWISDDTEEDRSIPRQKRNNTIWDKTAKRSSWKVKQGEYLCVICTIKRAWPAIVGERIKYLTNAKNVPRQIISTHTMASAGTLTELIDLLKANTPGIREFLEAFPENEVGTATLPAKLANSLYNLDNERAASGIYSIANALDESEDNDTSVADSTIASAVQSVTKMVDSDIANRLPAHLKRQLDHPESYYAILMMDGDSIGEWLSLRENRFNRNYESSWHSKIKAKLSEAAKTNADLREYIYSKRLASPSRHMAISETLSTFSTTISRYVIEQQAAGQLIYSGGDDVLAFLPISDLLNSIENLRYCFSGTLPKSSISMRKLTEEGELFVRDGWIMAPKANGYRGLAQMLGDRATASVGAVIAHKSTPLALAIRRAREAEALAKNSGRNRFVIRVMKRSGGDVGVVGTFDSLAEEKESSALMAIHRLSQLFADKSLSRTFLHNLARWLERFPIPEGSSMNSPLNENWWMTVERGIAFQLLRQSAKSPGRGLISDADAGAIAGDLITSVRNRDISAPNFESLQPDTTNKEARDILSLIEVAEFLGRRSDRVEGEFSDN